MGILRLALGEGTTMKLFVFACLVAMALADAEPKADADPYYGYYRLGYHGLGYYGKRSAEAEPTAAADADVEADPYYGYYGHGYGYGLGYHGLGYRAYGYGLGHYGYGHGLYGYYG